MRILLLDGDRGICDAVRLVLENEGYDVDTCQDGEEGAIWVMQQNHDLVLLDRDLPKKDGISILKAARAAGDTTPFIMLTLYGASDDIIDVLDAGADDYLIKPVDTKVLLARIRACLRRPKDWWPDSIVKYKDMKLHLNSRLLEWRQHSCGLTKREATLFEILMKSKGSMILRDRLFSYIWGADADVNPVILDHYINHARSHLKRMGCPFEIRTIRNTGFSLRG